MSGRRILVIDDEKHMCETLQAILECEDYQVTTSPDAKLGLQVLDQQPINLIISDVRLPGMNGIRFLSEVKDKYPSIPVVMISAFGNMKSAVEAMKRGAHDYLAKPFEPEELLLTVKKALEYENLMLENLALKTAMSSRHNLADMIGESDDMRRLKDAIVKVAPTDATVWIVGESGVGKELVAHSLHSHSKRISRPFIEVNCAAFPESLLESELFGYEKGAFTGADRRTPGKFELADGGTLYLDEIGDMSLAVQAKVLRGIQEKVFFRVGGSEPVQTDARIIAATNKNLENAIEDGTFREDLFYRLNVIRLQVPALRARGEDVLLLADRFLSEFKHKFPDRDELTLSAAHRRQLVEYRWPGNVRELKNLIERMVILGDTHEVDLLTLGDSTKTPFEDLLEQPLKEAVDSFKRQLITGVLEQTRWRYKRAAERLGLTRHQLRYQMESLGIRELED